MFWTCESHCNSYSHSQPERWTFRSLISPLLHNCLLVMSELSLTTPKDQSDRNLDLGSNPEFQPPWVNLWSNNHNRSFAQSPLSQPNDIESQHGQRGVIVTDPALPLDSSLVLDKNQNAMDDVNSAGRIADMSAPSTSKGGHTYQHTLRGNLLGIRPTFSQIFVMTHISPPNNQDVHRPSMASLCSSGTLSNSSCSPMIYARRRISDGYPRVIRRTVKGRKYSVEIPIASDKNSGN